MAGRLVVPGDTNGHGDRCPPPSAVAIVESVDDVIAVVRFARTHGLRVASSAPGPLLSPDATVVLDLSKLRHVDIDALAWRARVEAGAFAADVAEATGKYGVVVLPGSSPGVDLASDARRGGIGWRARSHGLLANSVTAMEIVTADGALAWADHDTEADLFWAVRGGGDGFGVVTAIELELFAATEMYAGTMSWPPERAGEVLRGWQAWVATVPDEIMSVARIVHDPAASSAGLVMVEAVFGSPKCDGVELLATLRALEPSSETFTPLDPVALPAISMDATPSVSTVFLDGLRSDAIDAIIDAAVPPTTVDIVQLGGALARPGTRHGAIGSLDAEFLLLAAGRFAAPQRGVVIGETIGATDPFPPGTDERLREVRAMYDPGELFVSDRRLR
jgi:FAD/FMN-containing dehydrogenase